MVLLTELRTEKGGMVWLEDKRVVLIQGWKGRMILRGEALEAWVEEGPQRWLEERLLAVMLGGMKFVSVYQASWGADEAGIER